MLNFVMENYFFLKTLHILGFVFWITGLIYISNLFIYHVKEIDFKSNTYEIFTNMEKKIFLYLTPCMVITVFLGGLLIHNFLDASNAMWIFIKLFCVCCLIIFHFFSLFWMNNFKKLKNKKSLNFFLKMRYIPIILFLIITAMAVYKPLN